MHAFLTSRTESIRHLCEKFKVRRLSAFGSICTESFTDSSDVDLLYLFDSERIPLVEYADNYFGFRESLQQLFQCKVDLVPEKTLSNPYFIDEIKKTQVLIYEFCPLRDAEYEQQSE